MHNAFQFFYHFQVLKMVHKLKCIVHKKIEHIQMAQLSETNYNNNDNNNNKGS